MELSTQALDHNLATSIKDMSPKTSAIAQNDQAATSLNAQLREMYGKAVYTHKTQQKGADLKIATLNKIKLWIIILSALTTTSLLIAVFGDTKICTVLGAIFSTALLGLTSYTKDYDLGQQAQKHTEAANDLWVVREQYFSLLTDLAGGEVDIGSIREKRDELQMRTAAINAAAPNTDYKAYAAAQKALKVNEELTFSDEEIDKFLPASLRSGNTKSS